MESLTLSTDKYANDHRVSFEPLDARSVETLKKWMMEQRIIPSISDEILKMFLHSCYYDLQATKNTLIAYYSLRLRSLELFTNRDCSSREIINSSSRVYCVLLPGTTEEGYKVCIVGPLRSVEEKEYVFKDAAKFILMSMDIFISENSNCPGFIILTDLNKYTFNHFRKFDLETLKNFITYFQDAFPIRLKKIVAVNICTIGNLIINMAFPFLNQRIRSMIHKYAEGDYRYMDIIPRDVLPVEYGGSSYTMEELQGETMGKLDNYKERFQREDKIITTLSSEQIKDNKKRHFLGIHY